MTTNNLNILFLASWFPNKLIPKNGNFIQQHALAVSKYCNVACLHALSSNQDQLFKIEENFNEGIYEVIIYYKKINSNIPIVSKYFKFRRQIQAYKIGYKLIVNYLERIDLVHLNVMFPAGIFALYLKSKFKLPYIISENWTGFLPSDPVKIKQVEKFFIKFIMKFADVICPVSKDLEEALKSYYSRSKFEIVPNVVNTYIFNYKPHKKSKRILHVSNLNNEQKNITGILDTIALLCKDRSDFFITIAGDGDFKYFQKYAKKLNIPENLYLIEGAKSYSEVASLMQSHDFFLLYSNFENLPCVIAESLVCGLPILSSKAGGTAEMVDDKSGVIIEPGNNLMLLKMLNFFLDNIDNYNNDQISKNAIQKYSYEAVGKQFLNVYHSVLKK
jgi:glycosyltransferase involved in cell wall biosynthesis